MEAAVSVESGLGVVDLIFVDILPKRRITIRTPYWSMYLHVND